MEAQFSFADIVANANDIVIVTKSDIHHADGPEIVYVNDAFCRLTGYCRDDVLGKSPKILQGPKTSAETRKTIRSGLLRGEAVRVEILNYSKDGKEYWLDLNIVPLRNIYGEITHFVAIERDITERKQVEKALAEKERFLETIIENIPNMIFVKDADDLRFVRFNAAGEILLGLSRQELLGKSDADLFPHDQAEFFIAKDREVFKVNDLVDVPEEYIDTRHKGRRILHTKKIPVRDQMGKPIYLLGISEDITERKQAESALKESEALFRSLFEYAPVGIALNAMDGRFVQVNRALYEMIGYGEDEFHHLTYWDITPREYMEQESQQISFLYERGFYGPYEKEYVHKDGHRIPVLLNGSLIKARDEQYFILSVIQDISERKKAEEALRLSEQRWQFALEGNGDGVWDWNILTNEVFWSKQRKRIVGLSEDEEVDSLSLWEASLHPDDREMVLSDLERHLQGETQYYQAEYRVRCKDGAYKWVLDRGKVIEWDGDGRPSRMIGTYSDIDERKRSERALKESEQRYRSLLSGMSEGVVLQDRDGVIVSHNVSAERILGLKSDQLLGCSTLDMHWHAIKEDGSPYPGEEYPSVITRRTGKACRAVIMGIHQRDDSIRWVQVATEPLFEEGYATPSGVVTTFHDVTERMKIDNMKNEFISVVSHELRTPLTSIRGSLGLLAGGAVTALPPKAIELVEIALRNCDRLMALINDLLDMEKITSGKSHLHKERLSLAKVLSHALRTNQPYGDKYKVDFVIGDMDANVYVEADHHRLFQVLTNLLSNAAKFSLPGTVVEVAMEARAAGCVRVKIADTGIGIPPEFRDRIFDKFAQADASATRQKGGTGLGLAISKAIIEQHGGTIGFYDNVPQGTVFYFDLLVSK